MAQPLELHDIRDTVAFVAAIARPHARRHGLSHHDAEDLHAYLLGTCWQLSLDFQPGGLCFSTWAGTTLRRRLVDYERKRLGRTRWKFKHTVYERRRPQLVPLEPGVVDEVVAARAGDSATDRVEAGGGVLDGRDRRRAEDLELLGLAAA